MSRIGVNAVLLTLEFKIRFNYLGHLCIRSPPRLCRHFTDSFGFWNRIDYAMHCVLRLDLIRHALYGFMSLEQVQAYEG